MTRLLTIALLLWPLTSTAQPARAPLEHSASPAGSFLLSEPTFGLATYFDSARIASDGESFLAVLYSESLRSFFTVRLDASGTPLDPQPVLLFSEATWNRPQAAIELVWAGDRYVLLWEDYAERPSSPPGSSSADPAQYRGTQ